jgi:hypothetical protein
MTSKQLEEMQQRLFFEFGHKVDIYHFENIREIVVVTHGEPLTPTNPLKVYKY